MHLGVAPSSEKGRWARVETLGMSSTKLARVMKISNTKDWKSLILEYIIEGVLPEKKWRGKKSDRKQHGT